MRDLLAIFRALSSGRSGKRRAVMRLVIVCAFGALSGVTSGALPAIVGVALDAVLRRPSTHAPATTAWLARLALSIPPWAALASAAVATIATVAIAVASSRRGSEAAGAITADLRVAMFTAALNASPRAVESAGMESRDAPAMKLPPGAKPPRARGHDVVKLAIARESGLVADFSTSLLAGLPQSTLTLLVSITALVMQRAFAVLVGTIVLFIASRLAADRASKRVARAMESMQRADAAVFSALGESLSNTEELAVLGARAEAIEELSRAADACATARRDFAGALAVSSQVKSLFTAASPLLVIAAAWISGAAEPGRIAEMLLIVPLLLSRLESLDALRTGLVERAPLLAATRRLLELPAWPPAHANAVSAPRGGDIEFRDVDFAPPGAKTPILKRVSLSIPQGAVVGVCGRSGSGKSTLLRLLLRLDDPTQGTISVGDVELTRVAPKELSSLFGFVGQSARLFERSVADNLALGVAERPAEKEMKEALQRVELDELVQAKERGLDTMVKLIPPNFSGGEQRRLALARVLLRRAPIVVVDEPEAGLPSATAEALLKRLAIIAEGRTLIVVTHAPHLLKSDFNVLLEGGEVVGVGTHARLSEEEPRYKALLADAVRG
jgi:ABC-type multidrug transport system fused ATPase/permease subunit